MTVDNWGTLDHALFRTYGQQPAKWPRGRPLSSWLPGHYTKKTPDGDGLQCRGAMAQVRDWPGVFRPPAPKPKAVCTGAVSEHDGFDHLFGN